MRGKSTTPDDDDDENENESPLLPPMTIVVDPDVVPALRGRVERTRRRGNAVSNDDMAYFF